MTEPYYADDHVTLYHGDCLEVTEWLTADVLVTDPPYGIRFDKRYGDTRGGRTRTAHPRAVVEVRDAIAGDKDPQVRDTALQLWRPKPAVVFGDWKAPRPEGVNNLLIWHKAGGFPGPANAPFFTNHEEIYVIGKARWRKSSPPLYSVITTDECRSSHTQKIQHPTAKPGMLMEILIDRCPPGVIADPFAGSGSTLVAAKALGRKAIGVELEERYCEIAARRLAQDAFDFGGAA